MRFRTYLHLGGCCAFLSKYLHFVLAKYRANKTLWFLCTTQIPWLSEFGKLDTHTSPSALLICICSFLFCWGSKQNGNKKAELKLNIRIEEDINMHWSIYTQVKYDVWDLCGAKMFLFTFMLCNQRIVHDQGREEMFFLLLSWFYGFLCRRYWRMRLWASDLYNMCNHQHLVVRDPFFRYIFMFRT